MAPVDSSDNFVVGLSSITERDVETLTATVVTAKIIKTDELVVSSKTSGNSGVKAGQKSVAIENDRVKENSKILVTFSSDFSPATRYLVTKDNGVGFSVLHYQPETYNSTFDWLIIN